MGLTDFFSTIISLLIGISSIIVLLAANTTRKERIGNQSIREEFLEVIVKSYSEDLLIDMNDIGNIYKSFYEKNRRAIDNKDLLGHLLRELLVNLPKGKYDEEIDGKMEFKKFITAMIEENEIENPFEELPKMEKALHNDMKVFIELNKTKESLTKLNELASLAVSKQLIVEKLNKQARWTLPLAVLGIVLSIFFGVQSFIK